MLKRVIISAIIFISILFVITIDSFAQTQPEKTDLEKIIDINNKITPEYLKQFAEEKQLIFPDIPKMDELQKKLEQKKLENYSYEEQKTIGKLLLEEFVSNKKLITNDPLMIKYVASVGKLIGGHIDDKEGLTYIFGVLDDPAIKIYTFPGGYIFVTKGFLKALNNEAQLAASLAREIAATNRGYVLQSLISNSEAITYLTYLKEIINNNNQDNKPKLDRSNDPAKELFSDPFKTLDYYAAPNLDNMFNNKNYVSKKLLAKMLVIIPTYETIQEKDMVAIKSLSDTGYDERSAKDLLIIMNKEQQQEQVVNRTINLENWLNNKNLNKERNNKVESRYYMMVERLNY